MKFKVFLLCFMRSLEKPTFQCIENNNCHYLSPPVPLTMAGSVLCKTCCWADKGYLAMISQFVRGEAPGILPSCIYTGGFFKKIFLKLFPNNVEGLAFSHGWRITKVVYEVEQIAWLQGQLEYSLNTITGWNKVNKLHISLALPLLSP